MNLIFQKPFVICVASSCKQITRKDFLCIKDSTVHKTLELTYNRVLPEVTVQCLVYHLLRNVHLVQLGNIVIRSTPPPQLDRVQLDTFVTMDQIHEHQPVALKEWQVSWPFIP